MADGAAGVSSGLKIDSDSEMEGCAFFPRMEDGSDEQKLRRIERFVKMLVSDDQDALALSSKLFVGGEEQRLGCSLFV